MYAWARQRTVRSGQVPPTHMSSCSTIDCMTRWQDERYFEDVASAHRSHECVRYCNPTARRAGLPGVFETRGSGHAPLDILKLDQNSAMHANLYLHIQGSSHWSAREARKVRNLRRCENGALEARSCRCLVCRSLYIVVR
ncbi:hypothetical protein BAUCODRAFT_548662 [Baudoinia panamericana UAMH 10762]|uniref:Uncharacterized protein n=1 Tax=Baudoinia panamericana (strain UAMH 10762) TaxID=717646 RepID=M2N5Z4_BAUPA|nr:uncharacterized protein BAUCODRAFT_548662 [Baudoinia panamericana UAMH 10762]EMC94454.1 hypothetical protein BAUCODRAFT_548662 [Baudoinia panamericana UAMH 10762]